MKWHFSREELDELRSRSVNLASRGWKDREIYDELQHRVSLSAIRRWNAAAGYATGTEALR